MDALAEGSLCVRCPSGVRYGRAPHVFCLQSKAQGKYFFAVRDCQEADKWVACINDAVVSGERRLSHKTLPSRFYRLRALITATGSLRVAPAPCACATRAPRLPSCALLGAQAAVEGTSPVHINRHATGALFDVRHTPSTVLPASTALRLPRYLRKWSQAADQAARHGPRHE